MKFTLTLILVCLFSGVSYGQTKMGESKANSATERELLDLVKKWNEADLKGDSASISSLLADEFSFLGGSKRAEYLNLMKLDPSLVIESATISNPSVQVYGNAAVVTTVTSFKLKKNGAPLEGRFLSMTVWIKQNGHWLCVKACMQSA